MVAESIYLPQKGRPVLAALKALGIDQQFLRTRLIPTALKQIERSIGEELLAASRRLSTIFGIELLADGTIVHNERFAHAAAIARFKLPSNAEGQRVKSYALYVAHLAEVVAASIQDEEKSIPTDWESMRSHLFGKKTPNYLQAVHSVWEMGIPVIPLSDPIRLHGCCVRASGRNVIVLKQSARFLSRWLFDLVHELYHAGEEPSKKTFSPTLLDATDSERREAESEQAANEFAGNVLLGGRAEALYHQVLAAAKYEVSRLKSATLSIASEAREDTGILANYIAFRLKADHFVDWWGTAANLQVDEVDAFELTRRIFFERVKLDQIDEDERALLEQAISEPKL